MTEPTVTAEPVAHFYQHDETGRTLFWLAHERPPEGPPPRYRLIYDLYAHPPMPRGWPLSADVINRAGILASDMPHIVVEKLKNAYPPTSEWNDAIEAAATEIVKDPMSEDDYNAMFNAANVIRALKRELPR